MYCYCHFSVSELSKVKTRTHKIKKICFSLDFVSEQEKETESEAEQLCTIEVLAPDLSDTIDCDVLQMYFEDCKSGGSEDCVQSVEILNQDIAHVMFHSPEGLFFILFPVTY